MSDFAPSALTLERYARVLIHFALNSGNGVKAGESVALHVPECAKPLLVALQQATLEAGAHPIIRYLPDGLARPFYDLASDEQLDFFPENFYRGFVDDVTHSVHIIASHDPHQLKGVPPEKIMKQQVALQPYRRWRDAKEAEGRFTWTAALYGTPAMAAEANLSLEQYWGEIINACYLDEEDPVSKWKEVHREIERVKGQLDSLQVESLHLEAENTDLTIKLGSNRQWMGGSGRNIPSFELFISPDWRGTDGHIQFTEPLYRYGNLITNVYLEFKEGRVVKATAEQGEDVLLEMIKQQNADKIGEFSLTDGRLSRITKFMAETLFDENVGGEQGNTHLALGSAYRDSYPGDVPGVSEEDWEAMGYNNSPIHTDIVATSRRVVTATLPDQSTRVIYADGQFKI